MKSLLCKLGIHKRKKGWYRRRRNKKGTIIARWTYCERCNKRLYRVNIWGERKEVTHETNRR